MNLYELADQNIFTGLVLILIMILIRQKMRHKSVQTTLFMMLCASIVGMLILDTLSWWADGRSYWLAYSMNFLFYCLEPVPLVLWLCYLDFFLYKSVDRLRKRWYYVQPVVLIVILMVVSIPSGFVFSLDSGNSYVRGSGVIVVMAIDAGILLFTMVLALRQRKVIGGRIFRIIVTFGCIPFVGSILQILLFGSSILWASVALSAIFLYLYLETQREIRDYLTGLLNRQQIDDITQSRITEFPRRGGFALIMMDMDGFKSINDRFGHKEGDRALLEMANILLSCVRNIDSLARFGGDEFMILLEETEPENVLRVIGRIRDSIATHNANEGRPYQIGLSCGYTIYDPTVHRNFADLQISVDQDMYAEKRAKARDSSTEILRDV